MPVMTQDKMASYGAAIEKAFKSRKNKKKTKGKDKMSMGQCQGKNKKTNLSDDDGDE